MVEVAPSTVEQAVFSRRGDILAQQETLTVKGVMRMLESDLGLKKKALKAHKASDPSRAVALGPAPLLPAPRFSSA